MLESHSIEGDEVHAKLVEAIEKPERAHLWVPADAIEFTPRVLPLVYGDGRALFTLATINQRPAYWVIRGCSTWGCDMDRNSADGPNFGDFTDNILTDLEEAFGNGRCGYSGESLFYPKEERHCDCEECQDDYVAAWPEVDGYGGCSWSRCDWPEGFNVELHPLSGERDLLALPPSPQPNLEGAYERHEAICTEAAMSQWERSLKRPDLAEKDRVRGAIDAYKRQAFAFNMLPTAPVEHMPALTDDQVNAVLRLVEGRLCIIWSKIGAREAFANELRVLEPATEDEDAECCVACDVAFEEGDLVYWCSDDTGHLHADCCGPERESYVNADGSPLQDGEEIPAPFTWKPATTEGSDNG